MIYLGMGYKHDLIEVAGATKVKVFQGIKALVVKSWGQTPAGGTDTEEETIGTETEDKAEEETS